MRAYLLPRLDILLKIQSAEMLEDGQDELTFSHTVSFIQVRDKAHFLLSRENLFFFLHLLQFLLNKIEGVESKCEEDGREHNVENDEDVRRRTIVDGQVAVSDSLH